LEKSSKKLLSIGASRMLGVRRLEQNKGKFFSKKADSLPITIQTDFIPI